MSEDWCHGIENRLNSIEGRLVEIEKSNSQLIKVVVVGLLTIVGAVVGVKIL